LCFECSFLELLVSDVWEEVCWKLVNNVFDAFVLLSQWLRFGETMCKWFAVAAQYIVLHA